MAKDTNPSRDLTVAPSQSQAVTMYDKIENPIHAAQFIGEQIFKSGLGGLATIEQATVVAWSALSHKKDPLEILNENHVIKGKLSRKADAMLAKFIQRGGRVKWTTVSKAEVAGTFTKDGDSLDFSFTIQDAKDAKYCFTPIYNTNQVNDGLDGRKEIWKDNWAKDPMSMLKARCISRAIGFMDPEAKGGYYTPEELQDMGDPVVPIARESAFVGGPAQAEVVSTTPLTGDAKADVKGAPVQQHPLTDDDLLAALKERYGSEMTMFEGYLLGIGWLQEGEGLPSLPHDKLERIYNNQKSFEIAFNTYKVKREKKGASNGTAQ